MNILRLTRTTLVTLMVAVALTGCSGKPKPKPGSGTGEFGPVSPTNPNNNDIPGSRPISQSDIENAVWGKFQPVLFAFDSAKISPSEATKLPAVAQYMKGNANKTLVIAGHCDERGTPEYNRSLGERRAQATREELVSLGVPADRITTVSYGKDKPADPGHDEAAWAKNRRCEFGIAGQ
jgi:peptidoglycan-associated lipoprotein